MSCPLRSLEKPKGLLESRVCRTHCYTRGNGNYVVITKRGSTKTIKSEKEKII